MAVFGGKGYAVQIDISSTLTTIPQCTGFDHSGGASQDFDSTTLDGGVGMTKAMTGYAEGGQVSFECFLDPTNTTHQAITDLILTPATHDWNLVLPDGASTNDTDWAFTSAGVEVGASVTTDDGIKMPVSCNVTGLMGYAT